jgi:hypothetical protein
MEPGPIFIFTKENVKMFNANEARILQQDVSSQKETKHRSDWIRFQKKIMSYVSSMIEKDIKDGLKFSTVQLPYTECRWNHQERCSWENFFRSDPSPDDDYNTGEFKEEIASQLVSAGYKVEIVETIDLWKKIIVKW